MALGGKKREREQEAQEAAWQTARERVQWFLTRAESFTGVVNGEDPTIPIRLHQGEHALLVLPSSELVEPSDPEGYWTGGSEGFSFRVARGAHYNGATAKGDADHTDDASVALDSGTATVTDRRVVFVGSHDTREWEYNKVLGFHHAENPPWTAIAVSGGVKVAGVRYDVAHAEAFRFSLVLGFARFHDDADSLVADLRAQLAEIDAQRPGSGAQEPTPLVAFEPPVAPAPVAPTPVAPEPVAIATPAAPEPVAIATPVAAEPVAVQAQPAPEPVNIQAPVPEPVAVPTPVAPEPVAVPEPVAIQEPVAPEPVAVPTPVPVESAQPSMAMSSSFHSTAPTAGNNTPEAAAHEQSSTTESAAPSPAQVAAAAASQAAASAATTTQTVAPAEQSPLPTAGWYHDPYGSARVRWWDGQQWTGHTA